MAVHRFTPLALPRSVAALSFVALVGLLAGCTAPVGTVQTVRNPAPPTAAVDVAPLPPAVDHAFPPNLDDSETPAPADESSATENTDPASTDAPAAADGEGTAEPATAAIAPLGNAPFTPTGSPQDRGAQLPEPTPATANEALDGPVTVALDSSLPAEWANALRSAIESAGSLQGQGGSVALALGEDGATRIALAGPGVGLPVITRYFAPALPFASLQDDITFDEIAARWSSGTVFTSESGRALLPALLGEPGEGVTVLPAADLLAALESAPEALALIGFEQIDPRYKILTVDGANLLSNQLQADAWPLLVQAGVQGNGAAALQAQLAGALEIATNRDPAQLTTLVMTGVTAMARGTADAIERSGSYAYPAEIVGPELALADITHVSNEIPFIEGCEVRNVENNLVLCSKPEYWAALEYMGTDIVGLSGNHVNDFGRDSARESLGWYKENNIPIYGSGITVDEACAPLLWEHNGNTFAFVAALAYGPESAWVTDAEPGACYYYEHRDRILSTISALANEVDIVAVELQYEETYFAFPTPAQVEEFRALRAAGAGLVTGVQSHVPQAQEPYGAFDDGGAGMISYGLGNLYFDQMWSWETRSELYLRHTIYNGRIVSSEILTGVLEDFAQPRWATPDERELILSTIFDGAPARP